MCLTASKKMFWKGQQMFTNDDYQNYFSEIEETLKKNIVIYTDLMSLVDNKSILSKLQVLALESSDAFKFIRAQKEKFSQE